MSDLQRLANQVSASKQKSVANDEVLSQNEFQDAA